MSTWVRLLAPLAALLATTLTQAALPPVKVLVEREGLYALSGADLQRAGVDLAALRPEALALVHAGTPVPRRLLLPTPGRLTPESRLLFPARPTPTRWSAAACYWLREDPAAVREMPERLPGTPAESFRARLVLEENHEYGYLIWAPERGELDPWFWRAVKAQGSATVSFDLPGLTTGAPGHLRVLLRGKTADLLHAPDHHATLALNGVALGESRGDNQAAWWAEATVPLADLREAGNELALAVPGDSPLGERDQVWLDRIEVEYPRAAIAPGDYLTPAAITVASGPDLRAAGWSADCLILAHDSLLAAVHPLAEYRRAQGLRVAEVPLGAVYDQFGEGVPDPHAIREFVRYACRQWSPPAPRYLLLVGDASYDPRDFLHTGVSDLLPAYPVRVQEGVETPSDSWYACVEGEDQVPELAVGRWPARTAEQVATLVRKTLAYEAQDPAAEASRRLLVVADHDLQADEAGWFEQSQERFWRDLLPLGYAPQAHYLRLTGISRNRAQADNVKLVQATATPKIVEAWQAGVGLVSFEGHGGALYWGREQVLTAEQARALSNPALPLVVEVTCFTGQFDRPDLPGAQCLAEALLTAPGGAVACLSPSRLGGLPLQHAFAQAWTQSPGARLGELFVAARQRFYTPGGEFWGPRETYNLLGDPALRVRLAPPRVPEAGVQVATAGGAEVMPGEERPWDRWSRYPDTNGNRLDDRLEARVAQRLAAGAGGERVELIVTVDRDVAVEVAARALVGLGAELAGENARRHLLAATLPAARVGELPRVLGEGLRFARWAGDR